MSSQSGIRVSKPVVVWNKSIKADFKELFKSLGKAAINSALGKWDSVATDVVDASAALGLAQTPEEIAWLLVYRSLTQALFSLVEGNKDLLGKEINSNDIEIICNHRLDLSLEKMELCLEEDFFRHPKNLPIIEAIKIPFAQWLEGLGISKLQAETISHCLPTYFVYSLHEEWASHPEKYACLKEELNTPFTQASEREQAWQRYSAYLQKQVEEPMFLEAFGLKQIYVPLNAYYLCKVEGQKDNEFEFRVIGEKQEERIVIDLEVELATWLKQANRHDAIRVISGGPGSGKSSFAKVFAAKQAEKGEIATLFVPLHHFDSSDNLVDAIGKFLRINPERILPPNPLVEENAETQLLIIFDGLDELAMQGKVGTEVAQQFIREVQRQVDRFNQQKTRLLVLICGRELIIQANSSDFRQPKQILHILPYFVAEEERKNYIDGKKLLEQDKRQIWWQLYGKAKGYEYVGLPPELDINFIQITSQPLLNYLVALSFARSYIDFTQQSNLNTVYNDLLKAVYERGWAGYQHPSISGISENQFVRILEEIALASWHGDGRTTTVKEIESHCDNSGLKSLLAIFQEGAKVGVTRLLTAFYFRQSGFNEKQGEKTFEFTHKSFCEYLTAKRIMREVRLIHRKLEERKNDPDDGWDEKEALKRWAIVCGASVMDNYIFRFVIDEIRLQNISDVRNWQQTLCHLIGFMLRHGMPMERLSPRLDFKEENRQARNAEEALLAVLNACARMTQQVSEIKWHSPEVFGAWISRLQGQRVSANVFCLHCLSFFNLQNCILFFKDFYEANLERTYFVLAYLVRSNLVGANLERANLERATLAGANLERSYLVGANLERASLEWVNLAGANLAGANLAGANLTGANLERANLIGANLEGANLERANLKETILEGSS